MNLLELFKMPIEYLWLHTVSIKDESFISRAWLVIETNDGATYDVDQVNDITSDLIYIEVPSNDKNYWLVAIPAASIRLVACRFINGRTEGTTVFRSALPKSWPWHG